MPRGQSVIASVGKLIEDRLREIDTEERSLRGALGHLKSGRRSTVPPRRRGQPKGS